MKFVKIYENVNLYVGKKFWDFCEKFWKTMEFLKILEAKIVSKEEMKILEVPGNFLTA